MTTDPKNDTELLLGAVIEMRSHQRNFFRNRLDIDKLKSIRAEQDCDRLCMRLKIEGYKPRRQFKDDTQQKLFD